MRFTEIINESGKPVDLSVVLLKDDQSRGLVPHGDGYREFDFTSEKDLRNILGMKEGLLFHGTADGSITNWQDYTWFTSSVALAITHADFKKSLMHGPGRVVYGCEVNFLKPLFNPSVVPGDESDDELNQLYSKGYDALVWTDVKDAGVGTPSDLYNVKNGSQVKTVASCTLRIAYCDADEFEQLLSGKPNNSSGKSYKVIDPGLTPFNAGDLITADEYEEYGEHFGSVEPIHSGD